MPIEVQFALVFLNGVLLGVVLTLIVAFKAGKGMRS